MKRANVNTRSGVIYDTGFKRIYVKNIQKLTNDQICVLNTGDEVIKETGSQKHTYIVSYKEQGQGMCLTYTDATYVETVSYDLVNGVWTYNSTDSTELSGGGSGGGGTSYEAGTGIDITGSTISVDTSVVQTKLYSHHLLVHMLDGCDETHDYDFYVISTRATSYDNTSFKALFDSGSGFCKYMYECYLYDENAGFSYHCEATYNERNDKFGIATIGSNYYIDSNLTLASIETETINAL